jgi:hypothetical protein
MDSGLSPKDKASCVDNGPGLCALLAQRAVVGCPQAESRQAQVERSTGEIEIEADRRDPKAGPDHAGQHAIKRTNDGGNDRLQQRRPRFRGLLELCRSRRFYRHQPLRIVTGGVVNQWEPNCLW